MLGAQTGPPTSPARPPRVRDGPDLDDVAVFEDGQRGAVDEVDAAPDFAAVEVGDAADGVDRVLAALDEETVEHEPLAGGGEGVGRAAEGGVGVGGPAGGTVGIIDDVIEGEVAHRRHARLILSRVATADLHLHAGQAALQEAFGLPQ